MLTLSAVIYDHRSALTLIQSNMAADAQLFRKWVGLKEGEITIAGVARGLSFTVC